MTNATAMTFSLAIFLAVLVAAVYIILWGGGLHVRRHRSKPSRGYGIRTNPPRHAD